MTGYIASLLGRTYGEIPLLTPRTPSVFEPALDPEPEPFTPQTTFATQSHAIAPESPHATRVLPNLASDVAKSETIEIIREERITTPSRERILESPPRIETHERVVAAPPEIETHERTLTTHEPAKTIRNIVREPAPPARTITREHHVVERPEERIVLADAPTPRRRTTPLQITNITQRPALTEQRNATTSRRTSIERARNAQASTTQQSQMHAEAPEAEPTIRVTIGRVDVRAVVKPESARSTRSEAAGPRLSLDDYLRMRDGGSR